MTVQHEWEQQFFPGRDIPLFITVPITCCHPLTDKSGKQWCEVFVPPKDLRQMNDPWSTIVVNPDHVFYINMEPDYYMFWINSGAMLTLYYKALTPDGFQRKIIGSEQDTAENILARFLQYEAYRFHRIRSGKSNILRAIERDYLNSGQTMYDFIKTLH